MYLKKNEITSNIDSNVIISDDSVIDSLNNKNNFLNYLNAESITGNITLSSSQCNSNIFVKDTSDYIEITLPPSTIIGQTFTFVNNDSETILKTGVSNDIIYVNGGGAENSKLVENSIIRAVTVSPGTWTFISYYSEMAGLLLNDVNVLSNSVASNSVYSVVDSDGQAWSWGRNQYGEAGNNTTNDLCAAAKICGGYTFCQIETGDHYMVALDHNGQAWAWGYNQSGRLGDNSTTNKSTPVQVCGGHTFCQISAGYSHILAIDNNGQAWAWGDNSSGQLGDNSRTAKSTPIQVCGGHIFCQIGTGFYTTLAIDYNGQAWGWGRNNYGQLGDNSTTSKSTPIQVCGGHTFCKISTQRYHILAIDHNGQAWAWGHNSSGQLGDNSRTAKSTPIQVCGGHTFCEITAGLETSNGKDVNGDFWVWGRLQGGSGLTDYNNPPFACCTPEQVCNDIISLKSFQFINYNAGVGIDINDKLWTWGSPEQYYQTAQAISETFLTPVKPKVIL